MAALTTLLKFIAPVPILVGLMHLVLGLQTDVLLGANVAAELLNDPVLDSQNRFYGAIFMGYGALIFLCTTNLRQHATLFRILSGGVFLGGLARVVSIALHGVPSTPVLGLVAIERFGVPLLVWWHSRVLQQGLRLG